MLGNIDGARAVFERWMQWQPDKSAWVSYIGLETRHGNFERARGVFERYLLCHATCESYLQYAAFEAKRASTEAARAIYERCAVELGEAEVWERSADCFPTMLLMMMLLKGIKCCVACCSMFIFSFYCRSLSRQTNCWSCSCVCVVRILNLTVVFLAISSLLFPSSSLPPPSLLPSPSRQLTEEFYLKFSAFEERNKEYARARATYKFALEHLPKHRAEELYRRYTQFEKQVRVRR
jgi:hypothetical protein